MEFQHIEYLVALLAVPVMVGLYFLLLRWKKRAILKIGDPALVNQLVSDYSATRFSVKFILFVIAFSIGVIALANPRMPLGTTNVQRSGIDVMIALDVSRSMMAQDIKPDRLSRAKQLLSRLIDQLADDRIGIVVFAGKAYLQMPLTTDHAAAKMYLSSATPNVVPTQGTVIADALKMCFAAFNPKEKKYKSIILISDGEDHDENAESLAKSLANEGVMINTIGIGSPEGAMIVDSETKEIKRDAVGLPVVTKLNEAGLKKIAAEGNGIYQLYTNTEDIVQQLQKQIGGMGQKPIKESSLMNFNNFFYWLLAIVLVLLLVEMLVTEKKATKNRVTKKAGSKAAVAIAMIVGLLTPLVMVAQNGDELVKEGNKAYTEKKYAIAAENYKKATEKNPANPRAQYNLGNALYRDGKPSEAVAAYDESIQSSRTNAEKATAFYNKGVVLQNDKKLPECIEAYKNALRLNPGDEDARLNLQKALQQQQQQQKENKDKKEEQKPKDDPKKKDQQKEQEKKEKDQLPKPQPSKMTKKEAEEKLKALLQQEKKLQDKLRKVGAASPEKPEKDW